MAFREIDGQISRNGKAAAARMQGGFHSFAGRWQVAIERLNFARSPNRMIHPPHAERGPEDEHEQHDGQGDEPPIHPAFVRRKSGTAAMAA